MSNLYSITDFAGQPVPGYPPKIALPVGTTPRTYKRGVYVFGTLFWCAHDLMNVSVEERGAILSTPHQLFYGYDDAMIHPGAWERVLCVEGIVNAVKKALADRKAFAA